jgi:RNA polymerase sigma-70 factor (ECF subfamily)
LDDPIARAEAKSRSDSQLIALSAGTPHIFGEIFDRHSVAVLRFFVRRVGPDDAGGLMGEVFRVAFQRRLSYDATHTSALPWLYGIAGNQIRNHRRSQARRLGACLQMAIDIEHNSEHESIANEEARDARLILPKVAHAIDELPDDEREALLLFALEGLPYGDIASSLEIPIGTVRSRINRARVRLRTLLPGGAQ